MAKETTYSVVRIVGTERSLPTLPSERDCAFQLDDARWRLVFRDGRSALSGGLLLSRLTVDSSGRRTSRVEIRDDSGRGFDGAVVVRSPAAKVRSDLQGRLASLERAGAVQAEVTAGSWWLDGRVFDGLDWSRRRSIAGVHYRAGWWGTARLRPSMLPKVLDFGPQGVAMRGWRNRLVIPWDTVESLQVLPGDCWVPDGTDPARSQPIGSTLVVRSRAGQDAVFFTPLLSMTEAVHLVGPLLERLPAEPALV